MKARALIEILMVFTITLGIIVIIGRSAAGPLELRTLHYPFLEYLFMIVLSLIILLISDRKFEAYGLSLKNAGYHADIAATLIIPFALAGAAICLFNHKEWTGGLFMSVIKILLLFLTAWLLKNKPTFNHKDFPVKAIPLSKNALMKKLHHGFFFYIRFKVNF